MQDKSFIPKSSPQDIFNFQNEITDRYPGYETSKVSLDLHFFDGIYNTSTSPPRLMGHSKAPEDVELLYETLFPPKPSSPTSNATNESLNLVENEERSSNMQECSTDLALLLPLTEKGFKIPKSISEAGETYMSNTYISLANYQMMKERQSSSRIWTDRNNFRNISSKENYGMVDNKIDDTIDSFEEIYVSTWECAGGRRLKAANLHVHKNNAYRPKYFPIFKMLYSSCSSFYLNR